MIYRTLDGDVLDQVCLRHYERTGAVEVVLDANPGLSAMGAVLPAGVEVELPELPDTAVVVEVVRLWD
ncbi:MAG: tail protein X [Candidatus Thiodiazotropha sp. (ex Dulcina madagascariensis)]|nr:tail protein X [Candidatus Thiodiazotropha sp. (ex Dulcina madagascariensis)]